MCLKPLLCCGTGTSQQGIFLARTTFSETLDMAIFQKSELLSKSDSYGPHGSFWCSLNNEIWYVDLHQNITV